MATGIVLVALIVFVGLASKFEERCDAARSDDEKRRLQTW